MDELVEDALDLAAVDVEFSGYGALALARLVPRADGLLQGRRSGEFGRCFLYQGWYDLVPPARPHLAGCHARYGSAS